GRVDIPTRSASSGVGLPGRSAGNGLDLHFPLALGQTLGYAARLRRGGRAVEGACLESKCTVTPYRGFESHPLRQPLIHASAITAYVVPYGGVRCPQRSDPRYMDGRQAERAKVLRARGPRECRHPDERHPRWLNTPLWKKAFFRSGQRCGESRRSVTFRRKRTAGRERASLRRPRPPPSHWGTEGRPLLGVA